MNRGLRNEWSFLTGCVAIGLLLSRKSYWAILLGLCAAGLRLLPAPSYSLSNRSVIITGGSRGLGFALAESLLKEGAWVTLLARDPEELKRAQTALEKIPNAQVITISCNITVPDELKQALEQVEERFGWIDILINNAGSISVGPFETMEQSDFDAQMNLHLQAVINAIQFVKPAFQRIGEGRIVNISSIGGALPVPHMSSYCTSKFALAGLSESVAAELALDNIKVTTVYPGLMRTGSPIQAVFKGDHEKEYGWFATSNVMPGLSVSAKDAAKKILEGVRNGDSRVTFPMVTKLGIFAHAAFPETYALFSKQATRLMPKGKSHVRKTGAESQGWLEKQVWYKPFKLVAEKAETRFNQQEKLNANFNLGIETSPFY